MHQDRSGGAILSSIPWGALDLTLSALNPIFRVHCEKWKAHALFVRDFNLIHSSTAADHPDLELGMCIRDA